MIKLQAGAGEFSGRTASMTRSCFKISKVAPDIPAAINPGRINTPKRSAEVSLRDDLGLLTPRLRRYAQALSSALPHQGENADALVQRTLTHALQMGALNPRSDITIWLFSLLTQFHRDSEQRLRGALMAGESQSLYGNSLADKRTGGESPAAQELGSGLAALSLEEREALLLVVLEHFSYGQASHILRISRGMLIARLSHARTALAAVIGLKQNPSPLQKRPPYLRLVK